MNDTPIMSATAPPSGFEANRAKAVRRLVQTLGIGFFYILVLVFFSIASGNFFTYSNALNILTNVAVIGIVALGQALTIISGGFDLSVGGTMPLGAVLFALFSNAGYGFPLSSALVLAAGACVGLFNGLVITKLKINPLIATLGTLSITSGLAFTVSDGVTIPLTDAADGWLADFAFNGVSYYLLAFAVLAGAMAVLLRFTLFGRMLYSVGGNREASHLAGIRVDAVTVAVYMICAALSAFAGIVIASQLLAGSATVGSDAALSSIAAVVLGGASLTGGIGGIGGTLIGVLILGTIANGMVLMQVPAFYQQIATGAILLLGVGFARLRESLSQRAG
ncbi:ABC transporter permease [Aureimonas sp. AU40]|uniref:ABC transporter permease n=1 Tax=Aureimonas sp. AU40 TaxID=1637747 RepID=UPI0007831026|nr:ABC transporter permease [Aureimonas sp. AU40]